MFFFTFKQMIIRYISPCLVPVLPGNVPADSIVAREGSMTEGTGYPDALVPLPDVRPQVRLVSVGPLAERTFELSS